MNARNADEAPGRDLSIEEYGRLPADEQYLDELVRGRVVREPRPGPAHGRLTTRIAHVLHAFVEANRLGVVLTESGYILGDDPPTVRGPDISFVAEDRIPVEGYSQGFWRIAPDLAVEIVSRSNTAAEIRQKTVDYLDAGVRLIWVVHPRTRTVVVHGLGNDARVLGQDEVLAGGDVVPGFLLRLADLFGA